MLVTQKFYKYSSLHHTVFIQEILFYISQKSTLPQEIESTTLSQMAAPQIIMSILCIQLHIDGSTISSVLKIFHFAPCSTLPQVPPCIQNYLPEHK